MNDDYDYFNDPDHCKTVQIFEVLSTKPIMPTCSTTVRTKMAMIMMMII